MNDSGVAVEALVDGREVVLDERFDVLDPATGERIASVGAGSAATVDEAVAAARRAFDEGPWPRMMPKERAKRLRAEGRDPTT